MTFTREPWLCGDYRGDSVMPCFLSAVQLHSFPAQRAHTRYLYNGFLSVACCVGQIHKVYISTKPLYSSKRKKKKKWRRITGLHWPPPSSASCHMHRTVQWPPLHYGAVFHQLLQDHHYPLLLAQPPHPPLWLKQHLHHHPRHQQQH